MTTSDRDMRSVEKTFRRALSLSLVVVFWLSVPVAVSAQRFTLVEMNCENMFDCRHDSLKQDTDFMPGAVRRWSLTRYWRKLNNVGQAILSCADNLPDLVALCEVENDSVVRDLARRSLLRGAGYDYLMTQSPDVRGLDVALLYHPARFRPLCYDVLTVTPLKGMRPTRDILYVKGITRGRDTLHVFVVHLPSRYGGERRTRRFRLHAVDRLMECADSLVGKNVLIVGDFNDHADSPSVQRLCRRGFVDLTRNARGRNGSPGNYRYRGRWQSLDHVLASPSVAARTDTTYVNDEPFLLEDEPNFGGKRPRRTYNGLRYNRGTSDHLPVVANFSY